jgi:hypothetical protein
MIKYFKYNCLYFKALISIYKDVKKVSKETNIDKLDIILTTYFMGKSLGVSIIENRSFLELKDTLKKFKSTKELPRIYKRHAKEILGI